MSKRKLSFVRFSVSSVLPLLLSVGIVDAMAKTYSLDLRADAPAVHRGQLDLGGSNPSGQRIDANNIYIEQNGRPFMPIIGEFHYCRCPAAEWEEELRKMKAGGINTVATYVFWNVHERAEGKFDWSGDLDLHRFIELTRKVGLQMILRVGPFDHGEIRNGGLPDWLYGRAFEVRSNDPGYLDQVEKLYGAISAQIQGELYKDGGPIIAIQLENEYQHSAAPWEIRYAGSPREYTVASRDVDVTHQGVSVSSAKNANADYGSDHMANLKLIAKKHGLDAPLYTATGWGNAAIVAKGSLPVTAAYPYPFWTPTATPSPFYLFKDIRRHPDYAPVSFDPELYPSLPAELGSGMSMTYARRAYVPEDSVEPMIIRVLGSVSNGIGYYMYHGGATPVFDKFYNEDASGLPKINYDYQAPLGQYGKAKSHYYSLRLLHLFLASYGERLAPLGALLPPTNDQIVPSDTKTLRLAARAANGSGFIFLTNYQDHVEMRDLPDITLKLQDNTRVISIPARGTFTLRRDESAILPVNMEMGDVPLRSATVQPLTILRKGEKARYVFFSIDGLPPEFVFDRGEIADAENCTAERMEEATVVRGENDRCFSFVIDHTPVLVVPRKLALEAVDLGNGSLLFANALVTLRDGAARIVSSEISSVDLAFYPGTESEPEVTGARHASLPPPSKTMSAMHLEFAQASYSATWRQINSRRFAVRLNKIPSSLSDVIMRVNYVGDTGMAFVDGQMIDDHFYCGRPWEIALRRFMPQLEDKEIVFVFQGMSPEATYLKDIPDAFRPKFPEGAKDYLAVKGVEFIPEYEATLRITGDK